MAEWEEQEGMDLPWRWGCPGSRQVPGTQELLVHPHAEGAGTESRATPLPLPTPTGHFCQLSSSVSQRRAHRHPHAPCEPPHGVSPRTCLFLRDTTPSQPASSPVQRGPASPAVLPGERQGPQRLSDHPSGGYSLLSHL